MGRVSRAHGHASKDEIKALLRTEEGRRHSDKLLVILNAIVDPRPARQIALHLNVSVHSVHAWVSAYNRFGVEALFGPGPGGRRNEHMTKEEESLFLEPFFERAGRGEITTVAEIRESLEERVGKPLHHSVVYRFLNRNGWRRIKPRPSHVKGNKEEQEDFKEKEFPAKVAEILAERDPEDSRPVAIMSQDEGRFGRISDLRYCWAPEGMRPKVPSQIVRKFLYVYTAVCMTLGKMTSLILPYANIEMMNLFLQAVAEDFEDFFVIMLVDRAGWHMSRRLKIPQNIRLIPQPPYSPELNPVEHIWEHLREKATPNKAFKSLDQLQDVLCVHLRALENAPDKVRSMTNFPYMRVI